jgi:arylsulfatase A-like enzyme
MADRPNIIQIIWRDLGDWLGCYGRPDVESPALDQFAAQGALLEQHFATASSSSPSHTSLMTGLHPHPHEGPSSTRRGWDEREDEQNLPALLGRAGYDTARVGFRHERGEALWSSEPLGATYGQDDEVREILAGAHLSAAEVATAGVEWLVRTAARDSSSDHRPFFLSIDFLDVARPYGTDFDVDVAERLDVPGFLPDESLVRTDLATLYERIRRADAAVGRILTALDDVGLSQDTFVFFTADQGPELPRAKMTLYDPGIKVAFLCRWPGVIPAGRRLLRLTSHVDVLPTLLEVAGLPIPPQIEGRSFLKRLQGERGMTRDAIFAAMTWHDGEYDPMRCMRTWQYKYIRNWQPGWPVQIGGSVVQRYGEAFMVEHFGHARPAEELYDLQDDPWELHNLAGLEQHQDVKRELADRLGDWMATLNDPLLRGPIATREAGDPGSGNVWVKAPTHDPENEEFRWALLRTRDFGEMPFSSSEANWSK